ncbi:pyridoxal-phosphate dependent enzyme [Longispora urticae]
MRPPRHGSGFPDQGHTVNIQAAIERIGPYITRTPCELAPDGTWLKREDLQRCGSFKVRGVLNHVLSAPGSEVRSGVVCASSGNTGRALCFVAEMIGTGAHVFLPARTAAHRIARLSAAGGTVHLVDGDFADVSRHAGGFAREHRMLFCSPGASWQFVYGVATVAVEAFAQADIEAIWVPVGGGGLAVGVGLAAAAQVGKPRVVGVQVEASPFVFDLFHGLSGSRTIPDDSVADCLTGNLEDGAIVKDELFDVLDDVLLVSESRLVGATSLLGSLGIRVEPGAAAGYAGALAARGSRDDGRRTPWCAVLTGDDWPVSL